MSTINDYHLILKVLRLTSVDEYLPWYELVDCKLVSKDWNEIIDETLEYKTSIWINIINHINSKNKLNICPDCLRPLLPDGTALNSKDVCQCTTSSCILRTEAGCTIKRQHGNHGLNGEEEFQNLVDPRLLHSFTTTYSPRQQAKKLFVYHEKCIKRFRDLYKQKMTQVLNRLIDHDVSDRLEIMNFIQELKEYNNPVYQLVLDTLCEYTAIMALRVGPYNKVLPTFDNCSINIFAFALALSLDDNGVVPDVEFFLTDAWRLFHSLSTEKLLGRRYADCIDMLRDTKKRYEDEKDSMFPLKWMPCMGELLHEIDTEEEADLDEDDDDEFHSVENDEF